MSLGGEPIILWLRWAGVLPAAALAGFAVGFVANMGLGAVVSVLGESAQQPFVSYLLLLLFYVPKEAAFVVAGAKVAPRFRLTTATVLAALRLVLSLATHVLTQAHRGVTNYQHLALEWTGALLGAGCIALTSRRR